MDDSRSPSSELERRLEALIDGGALADAATEVIRGYGPGILGYLGALLREDEAAREAFSEFAEELWKALPRFARKSSVKTWAYAIAYHSALRHRRARSRRRTRPIRDSEYSKLAASVHATSQAFCRTAADRKLDALRRSLTDEEQTLLVLRLDRRMSWDEIAEVLRSPPGGVPTLRKRFQRLKDRLRRAAEREGLIAAKE